MKIQRNSDNKIGTLLDFNLLYNGQSLYTYTKKYDMGEIFGIYECHLKITDEHTILEATDTNVATIDIIDKIEERMKTLDKEEKRANHTEVSRDMSIARYELNWILQLLKEGNNE